MSRVVRLPVILVLAVLQPPPVNAWAERRPLDPPPEVQLVPADHFSEEFAAELDQLGQLVDRLDAAELDDDFEALLSTLITTELAQILGSIERHSERISRSLAEGQAETLRQLEGSLGKVREMIEDERHAIGVPIALSTDRDARLYEVRWHEGDGTGRRVERLKSVPFRPQMTATVASSYDPATHAYGYRISNSDQSEVAAGRLWLEALGVSPERLEILAHEGHLQQVLPEAGLKITIFKPLPGYLQDFRIHVYNLDGSGRWTEPGDSTDIPPLLSVPWPQLPGVVRCWLDIPPTLYDDGISAEYDPIIATEIFHPVRRTEDLVTGGRKVPRLMQEGRALGPVPLAALSDSPKRVLETLQAYLHEARDWGWFAESEETRRFEERLRGLAEDGFPRVSLDALEHRIGELHRDGSVLDEALILIREYLRYLRGL